jgi:hypothetical protein
MVARFDVGNYDEWKGFFDSDPVDRTKAGKGHRILRNVDDPNDVFISVQFDSPDDAKSFREKLVSSGVLDRVTVKIEPTVTEVAEEKTY